MYKNILFKFYFYYSTEVLKIGRIHYITLNKNMKERTREGVIYYEELDHVVMEAEKSQDLQSAVWRYKRANGIIPA